MSLLGLRSLGVFLMALALAFFPPFYPLIVEPVLIHASVWVTGRSLAGLQTETLASTLTTLELHERALEMQLDQAGAEELTTLQVQLHHVKRQRAQVQQALLAHGLTPSNVVGFGLGVLGLGLLSRSWGRRRRDEEREVWASGVVGVSVSEPSSEEVTRQAHAALGPELSAQVLMPGHSAGGRVGRHTELERSREETLPAPSVFLDTSVARPLEEVVPRVDAEGLPVDFDFSSFDPEALMARLEVKAEAPGWEVLSQQVPEGEGLRVLVERLMMSGQELAVLGVLSRWLALQQEGQVRLSRVKERLEVWLMGEGGQSCLLTGPGEVYQRLVVGWVETLRLDTEPQLFVMTTPKGVQVQRLRLSELGVMLETVSHRPVTLAR